MDLFHGLLLLLLFKCDEIRNRCYVQLSNAQEKNRIPQQESNPGPSRYRYDAPTTELWATHLASRSRFLGWPQNFLSRDYAGLKQSNTLAYLHHANTLRKCCLHFEPNQPPKCDEIRNRYHVQLRNAQPKNPSSPGDRTCWPCESSKAQWLRASYCRLEGPEFDSCWGLGFFLSIS